MAPGDIAIYLRPASIKAGVDPVADRLEEEGEPVGLAMGEEDHMVTLCVKDISPLYLRYVDGIRDIGDAAGCIVAYSPAAADIAGAV